MPVASRPRRPLYLSPLALRFLARCPALMSGAAARSDKSNCWLAGKMGGDEAFMDIRERRGGVQGEPPFIRVQGQGEMETVYAVPTCKAAMTVEAAAAPVMMPWWGAISLSLPRHTLSFRPAIFHYHSIHYYYIFHQRNLSIFCLLLYSFPGATVQGMTRQGCPRCQEAQDYVSTFLR